MSVTVSASDQAMVADFFGKPAPEAFAAAVRAQAAWIRCEMARRGVESPVLLKLMEKQ